MLRSANELINYKYIVQDGDMGRCKDFLFDEEHWAVRYMVADTGGWLSGKKVLISPIALGKPDWRNRLFPVNLKKEQIEKSPLLDEDAPVSRYYEMKYFKFYNWPYYWGGDDIWGMAPYPRPALMPEPEDEDKLEQSIEESHLRSIKEVTGYHIQADDGAIGHVEDFIVEDNSWMIRYLVVDTRNWLPGRKVLVSPNWFHSIDWAHRTVGVDLSTAAVKNSPEFDPGKPINREYEIRLYDYYGRPSYWISPADAKIELMRE